MTNMLDPMLNEFREEAAVTKRVLERVPADKLSWRPHAKSMSLGQLAIHIATGPGGLAKNIQQDSFEVSQVSNLFEAPSPKDVHEIHRAFEQSVCEAEKCLQEMTEQKALANWRVVAGGRELFARPRINALRSIMLNHWYHHRGQLSVYLRLLDVPVPVIYGRSADEGPLA
jgi:uncharacterized damage-inducible protein DinB